MTSTITPPALMPDVARINPELRLRDYQTAFRFYLDVDNGHIDEIIFLENSGADLAPFYDLAKQSKSRKKISLISTDPNYPVEMGKGYGEFLMLDNGFCDLSAPNESKNIWKVTGRLIVSNIVQMIERAPPVYDIYCDMRDVPGIGEALGGNKWMDLRLFSFTLDAYNKFLRGQFASSDVLEKAFFTQLMQHWQSGNINLVPRFSCQPIYEGVSGYSNTGYGSVAYRSKTLLRRVARRIAPRLWI